MKSGNFGKNKALRPTDNIMVCGKVSNSKNDIKIQ
jgi:hypothetical protein